ncbi:hypothetical protein BDF19DRAFT_435478 [Syncephalis fuscata]|nr:hypothetical protein BDF19DRAFT_435478 [Syncephalis fuscata]
MPLWIRFRSWFLRSDLITTPLRLKTRPRLLPHGSSLIAYGMSTQSRSCPTITTLTKEAVDAVSPLGTDKLAISLAQFRSLLWSLNIPNISSKNRSAFPSLRPRLTNELQTRLWRHYSYLKSKEALGIVNLSIADFYVFRQLLLRHVDETSARWILTIVKDMEKCGHSLDVITWRDAMNAYRALNDYTNLLATFEQLQINFTALPIAVWNLALLAHIRLGHSEEVGQFVEKMAAFGQLPDMQTYNRLMHRCAKLGDLEQTRQLFNQAISAGLEPTDYSYAIFIHASVNAIDVRGAARIFYHYLRYIDRKSIPASPVPFGALLQGLIQQRWYLAADKLWNLSFKHKVCHSVKLCNIRLRGLVAMGDMKQAEHLFQQMRGTGYLGTDTITYLEMIRGYTQHGLSNRAVDLLLNKDVWSSSAKVRKVHPGFSHLMATMIDTGNEAMLKELHVAMRSLPPDVMPDMATLNTLCARQRRPIDLIEARQILSRFRRMHAIPTLQHLVGHPLDAVTFYNTDLKRSGLVLNQHIYSNLFHAAYLLNDGSLAYTLWHSLQTNQQRPNWIVIAAAIRVFAAVGDKATCLRIYRTYREKEHIRPSGTVIETLLKGLLRMKAFSEAIAVWEELVPYYAKLAHHISVILMNGLCRESAWTHFEQVYHQLDTKRDKLPHQMLLHLDTWYHKIQQIRNKHVQ